MNLVETWTRCYYFFFVAQNICCDILAHFWMNVRSCWGDLALWRPPQRLEILTDGTKKLRTKSFERGPASGTEGGGGAFASDLLSSLDL